MLIYLFSAVVAGFVAVAAAVIGGDACAAVGAIIIQQRLLSLSATVASTGTRVSTFTTVAWNATNTAGLGGVSIVAGVLFGAVLITVSLESTRVLIGAGVVASDVCCFGSFIGSIFIFMVIGGLTSSGLSEEWLLVKVSS